MSTVRNASAKRDDKIHILVLGDVNLDTLLVPLPAPDKVQLAWHEARNYWRLRRRGGAWLIAEILEAALASPSFVSERNRIVVETYDRQLHGVDDPTIESTFATHYLTSAAILGLFPQTRVRNSATSKQVYRIAQFLGWIHNEPRIMRGERDTTAYDRRLTQCLKDFAEYNQVPRDILVLHDTASHFRSLGPEFITDIIGRQFDASTTWIVWHMYSPLAQGNLWDAIAANKQWLDRTIAVVSMECLREQGMNLPQTTSLEQESYLFVEGMQTNQRLKKLAEVSKIVAHQHREGALLYDRALQLASSCYYCPNVSADRPSSTFGTMVGYTSILVAAIVRGMVWSRLAGSTDPTEGIIAGAKQSAVLDHLHFLHGFGDKEVLNSVTRGHLANPYQRMFATLSDLRNAKWEFEGQSYLATALELPKDQAQLKSWSRVDGFLKNAVTPDVTIDDILCNIVRRGLKKVAEVEPKYNSLTQIVPDTPPQAVQCPYETHGVLKTADRKEIDSFANIRRIIEKYLSDRHWTSPLSIAVFGEPGSGKNFTIQQILESVNPEIAKRPLEFNMAQFTSPKDLEIAFHKIQDEAVVGQVPLVFFDEFDAEDLLWLKFFLAPMQDRKFKAGESTYRIGRAIFVFAGGVSKSWNEFYERRKQDQKLFMPKKGPDFVSRLRGYLDIPSINVPTEDNLEQGQSHSAKPIDYVLMFRRAILLRSLLEAHLPDVIDQGSKEARIDPDVVRAFLRVPRYEHEVRSMRAIIEMSRPSARAAFHKSALPAPDQLKMHVDPKEFWDLISRSTQKS